MTAGQLQALVMVSLVSVALLVGGFRTSKSYRWAMIFAGGIGVAAVIVQLVQPHH